MYPLGCFQFHPSSDLDIFGPNGTRVSHRTLAAGRGYVSVPWRVIFKDLKFLYPENDLKEPSRKHKQNKIRTDSDTLDESSWNNFNKTKEEWSEFPTTLNSSFQKPLIPVTFIWYSKPPSHCHSWLLPATCSSNSWTVKEMRSPTCRVEGAFGGGRWTSSHHYS